MNEPTRTVNVRMPDSIYRGARSRAGLAAMSLRAWIAGIIEREVGGSRTSADVEHQVNSGGVITKPEQVVSALEAIVIRSRDAESPDGWDIASAAKSAALARYRQLRCANPPSKS